MFPLGFWQSPAWSLHPLRPAWPSPINHSHLCIHLRGQSEENHVEDSNWLMKFIMLCLRFLSIFLFTFVFMVGIASYIQIWNNLLYSHDTRYIEGIKNTGFEYLNGGGSGTSIQGRDLSVLGQIYILKGQTKDSMQIKQLKQIAHCDRASNCNTYKGQRAGQWQPFLLNLATR